MGKKLQELEIMLAKILKWLTKKKKKVIANESSSEAIFRF